MIDADALNLIAADTGLQQSVVKRSAATVLTPHPAEAARLLGATTARVQAIASPPRAKLQRVIRSHVVLKGAGSICALPDGKWFINTSGNPGMASAGMGDVLTGIIAALLAQGVDVKDSAACGRAPARRGGGCAGCRRQRPGRASPRAKSLQKRANC